MTKIATKVVQTLNLTSRVILPARQNQQIRVNHKQIIISLKRVWIKRVVANIVDRARVMMTAMTLIPVAVVAKTVKMAKVIIQVTIRKAQ